MVIELGALLAAYQDEEGETAHPSYFTYVFGRI